MNLSKITLGELLSSFNETIKRNALSILKTLQRIEERKMLRDEEKQPLICTFIGCEELQIADGEFCAHHSDRD